MQIDRMPAASKTLPSETRSNNSGMYTSRYINIQKVYPAWNQTQIPRSLKAYDGKYTEKSKK